MATCSCPDGYIGNGDICLDVDECEDGTHTCSVAATCNNTAGTFNCTCNMPYTGDGIVCDVSCPSGCTCNNTEVRCDGIATFPEAFPMSTTLIASSGSTFLTVGSRSLQFLFNLNRLELINGQLDTLPDGLFADSALLEFVILTENKLIMLPDDLFTNNVRLIEIFIDNNRITSINGSQFIGLNVLVVLNLAGNQLTSIAEGQFADLTRLETLNLARNNLASLPNNPFPSSSDIETIDLTANALSALPNGFFTPVRETLRALFLGENVLSSLPPSLADLDQMISLNLNQFQGTQLPGGIFASMVDLESLLLSFSRLTSLQFDLFTSQNKLRNLEIEANELSSLPNFLFANCPSLITLDLSFNQLQGLPACAFRGLTSLREINLKGNSISEFQPGTFFDTGTLSDVNLEDNPLVAFPVYRLFSNVSALMFVSLANNAIPLGSCEHVETVLSANTGSNAVTISGLAAIPSNQNCTGPRLVPDTVVRITRSIFLTCLPPPGFEEALFFINGTVQSTLPAPPFFEVGTTNVPGFFMCRVVADLSNTVIVEPGSTAQELINNCRCEEGFDGNQEICIDRDECVRQEHNCDPNAACTNTPGSFVCSCNEFFTGNGVECLDIDECMLGVHNCHPFATCTNVAPGFQCECDSFAVGNGVQCEALCPADCSCLDGMETVFCGNLAVFPRGFPFETRTIGIDLSGSTFTMLPDDSFFNLTVLEDIAISTSPTLTTFQSNFLSNLPFLLRVEIVSMPNLTSIAEDVFGNSVTIEVLRLRQMASLTSLPFGIFTNLTSLVELVLEGMPLTSLPSLFGSFDITNLVLDSLRLTTIQAFGSNLQSLETLTISNMDTFTSIPSGAISVLFSLRNITLHSLALQTIPGCFFSDTSNIRHVNFTSLRNLTFLPSGLLAQQMSLESLNLDGSDGLHSLRATVLPPSTFINSLTLPSPLLADRGCALAEIRLLQVQTFSPALTTEPLDCDLRASPLQITHAARSFRQFPISCISSNLTASGSTPSWTQFIAGSPPSPVSAEITTTLAVAATSLSDTNYSCQISTGMASNTIRVIVDPGPLGCSGVCPTGFEGNGEICADVDECIAGLHSCLSTTGPCQNTVASYFCECLPGFEGGDFGNACTDIDECTPSPCNDEARCANFPGSFICTCNQGFTGDGFTCDDINECASAPCSFDQPCFNTNGSFMCACSQGLTGQFCEEDIRDECMESTNPCTSPNTAMCIDGPAGNVTCVCRNGTVGRFCETAICPDQCTCDVLPDGDVAAICSGLTEPLIFIPDNISSLTINNSPLLTSNTIPLGRNMLLTELVIDNTGVTNFDAVNNLGIFEKLVTWRVTNNNITMWLSDLVPLLDTLSPFIAVQTLDLTGNMISSIDPGIFRLFPNLTEFDFSGQRAVIQLSPVFLNNLTMLRIVRIEDCIIGSSLPEGLFATTPNLEQVILSGSNTTSLPEGLFQSTPNVTLLSLQRNSIGVLPTGLFNGLRRLQILQLFENQIAELPGDIFNGLDSMTSVDFRANRLTGVAPELFSGTPALRSVFFIDNDIVELPVGLFSSIPNLDQVFLDDNNIRAFRANTFRADASSGLVTVQIDRNPLDDCTCVRAELQEINKLVTFTTTFVPPCPAITCDFDTFVVPMEAFITPESAGVFLSCLGRHVDSTISMSTSFRVSWFKNGVLLVQSSPLLLVTDLDNATYTCEVGPEEDVTQEATQELLENQNRRRKRQVNGPFSVTNSSARVIVLPAGLTQCPTGLTGNPVQCFDIDECSMGLHSCNATTGSCRNEAGSVICQCIPGFEGGELGMACTETNECTSGTHNCDAAATCDNTVGSFICTCNASFFGDGTFCSIACPEFCTCNSGGVSCVNPAVIPTSFPSNTTILSISGLNFVNLPADIFRNLSQLTTLTMDTLGVTSLPATLFDPLTSLVNLRFINLMITELEPFSFSQLTALESVELRNLELPLENDTFGLLPSLTTLIMSSVRTPSLPANIFSQMPQLIQIELRDVNVTSLPGTLFAGNPFLERVTIVDLPVTELPGNLFGRKDNLDEVVLILLDIASLPECLFFGAPDMSSVTIQSRITELPIGFLNRVESLSTLDLAGLPNLQRLRQQSLPASTVGTINLPPSLVSSADGCDLSLLHFLRATTISPPLPLNGSRPCEGVSAAPVGFALTGMSFVLTCSHTHLGAPATQWFAEGVPISSPEALLPNYVIGPVGAVDQEIAYSCSVTVDGMMMVSNTILVNVANANAGGLICEANCPSGFEGPGIGAYCTDVNECIDELHQCNLQTTLCNNSVSPFECTCLQGYRFVNETDCEDNDECSDLSLFPVCADNAVCSNTVGSFFCECLPGFTGDPSAECQDINECESNPCRFDFACNDFINGFNCSCPDGLNGTFCENDVQDECELNICFPGRTVNCTDGASVFNLTCQCIPLISGQFCEIAPCPEQCVCNTDAEGMVSAVCQNLTAPLPFTPDRINNISIINSPLLTLFGFFDSPGANLTHLAYTDTGIQTVSDPNDLSLNNLIIGNLARNNLSNFLTPLVPNIEFVGPFPTVMVLNFDENRLSGFLPEELTVFPNLHRLTLARQRVPVSLSPPFLVNLTSLLHVDLSECGIEQVPSDFFETSNNIEELLLGGNRITSLPDDVFNPLSNLETLVLSGNLLRDLPSGLFLNQGQLKSLSLDRNHITSLPAEIFTGLTSMASYALNDNNISSLPFGLFPVRDDLTMINLENNNLSVLRLNSFVGIGAYANDNAILLIQMTGNPMDNCGCERTELDEFSNHATIAGVTPCPIVNFQQDIQCNRSVQIDPSSVLISNTSRGAFLSCFGPHVQVSQQSDIDYDVNWLSTARPSGFFSGNFLFVSSFGRAETYTCEVTVLNVSGAAQTPPTPNVVITVETSQADVNFFGQNDPDATVLLCPDGYAGGSGLCLDVDECMEMLHTCNLDTTTCTNTVGSFNCSCLSGHQELNANRCEDIDECSTSPCDANANCTNNIGSFTCACDQGFSGDGFTCADIDECSASPCNANANCTNSIGSFTCACNQGFSGDGFTCADINECSTSPCDTNANCTNSIGSFTCACNTGFSGDGFTCADIDECSASPCNANANCTNSIGSFTCACNQGFSGDGLTCADINECSTSPCDANANCTNSIGSFTCACNTGFSGDGFTCADIDECSTSPCDANANCTNSIGSFTCACNTGFSGDGFTCADIDECSTSPCNANANCTNSIGSFTCACNTGFSGDGFTCADIDECSASPCDTNANCTNSIGSFTCACNQGFSGDGFTCNDIDECSTSPCDTNANCTNSIGSFTCACNTGFSGDGLTCADIDECSASPCDANANCTNSIGSFTCACNTGFSGDGFTCADIDECSASPCDTNANCTNSIGSFTCACNTGFSGDGFTCADIDECSASPCDANANCTNSIGSFTCACNTGFSGDGFTCADIDECSASPCDTNANCTNSIGSFTCACNTGFSGDGFMCNDINECSTSPCDANANCTNSIGSFTCACNTGFSGDGFTCNDINECSTSPCDANANCTNNIGSFTCACNQGFSGDGFTCADIDECSASPCDANANCTNSIGSFTCACNQGFSGDGFTCNDINECAPSPCFFDQPCMNTAGSFICICSQGLSGDLCEQDNLDECMDTFNPCASPNTAMCIDGPAGNVTCVCRNGTVGRFCETAICPDQCSCTPAPAAGGVAAVCSGLTQPLIFLPDNLTSLMIVDSPLLTSNALPSGVNEQLRELVFNGTGITFFDIFLLDLDFDNLVTWRVSNSNISSWLTQLVPQIGLNSDLAFLTTLDLSGNMIASLHPGILSFFPNLEVLDLSNQRADVQLSPVFLNNLTRLRSVDFAKSNIASGLPEDLFATTPALETVNFMRTGIASLPAGLFQTTPNIQTLSLDENLISQLADGLLSNLPLVSLSLDRNRLSELPAGIFRNLSTLQSLRLSGNMLTQLPVTVFGDLTSLTTLFLAANQIDELPAGVFSGLTSVTTLGLQDNRMTSLPASLFANVPALVSLNLNNNNISELPLGLFTSILDLNTVSLANNRIRAFRANTFRAVQGSGPVMVSTSGNPLDDCTCVRAEVEGIAQFVRFLDPLPVCGDIQCDVDTFVEPMAAFITPSAPGVFLSCLGRHVDSVLLQTLNFILTWSKDGVLLPSGSPTLVVNDLDNATYTCEVGIASSVPVPVTGQRRKRQIVSGDSSSANATVTVLPDGLTECPAGLTGNPSSCVDIDECTSRSHNCDAVAVCTNSVASFSCACILGYTGNGVTCTDNDECNLDTHNCDVNAMCNNINGSFTCMCNTLFTGNGTTCEVDVPPGCQQIGTLIECNDVVSAPLLYPVDTQSIILLGRTPNFTFIDPNSFRNLPALTDLTIEDLRTSELPSGIFANIASLRSLTLTDIPLQTVSLQLLKNLTNLETIRFNRVFEQIGSLPRDFFSSQIRLEELFLSANNLNDVPQGLNISSLLSLLLDQNNISSLRPDDFRGVPQLQLLQWLPVREGPDHSLLADESLNCEGNHPNVDGSIQKLDAREPKISVGVTPAWL
ncbi:uncharacterized protein LOC135823645 [Sycon ciliatum]|uniref:uncharacterized protein LOC135823645 n=1 Tax=Sycon ciliatum TaxID=27933 RepID=UPI0031F627C9